MKLRNHWLCGAIALSALILWAQPGWTCMEPNAEFQLDGQTVPSTVEGAYWRHCENIPPDDDPEFSLYDDETDEEIPVAATADRHGLYELVFDEELDDDTTYRLTADPECVGLGPDEPGEWTFDTGGHALFPEDIGTWNHSSPLQGNIRFPGEEQCSALAEAVFVTFTFDPTDEAETWGRAISFETWVNGEIWEPQLGHGETVPAGASRLGWGEEQVYAVCDEDERPESTPHAEALEDGMFRIQIAARIPGTDLVWASPERDIPVRCDSDEDDEDDENESDDGGDEQNDAENDEPDGDDDHEPLEVDDESACSHTPPKTWSMTAAFVLLTLFCLTAIRKRVSAPVGE